MDLGENIRRIRDNLFLIPEARFDELVKDPGYVDSFIYLAFCLLISTPLDLAIALIREDSILSAIISTAIISILAFPVIYIVYFIQFLLLKLVGGKAGFLQSVQVFIYGSTLSLILSGIPCIGFIASLISLANIVVGSARIHQISVLRALLALLVIPVLILVVIGIIFAMFFYASETSSSLLIPA
jgi:hypothetical protein